MKYYKVITRDEHDYLKVLSWKEWSLDNSFIEFDWNGEILILPKSDILVIKHYVG